MRTKGGHIPRALKKAADRIGENAPHGGLVGRRDNAHCDTAAAAEDPAELGQSASRICKELQAKLADDTIEAGVPERQCLAVSGHRPDLGSSNRTRAPSSIAGEISAPTTKPDAPTTLSAPSAASPVPVETSSTRHPGATSAAPSTEGTNSRDHRPVKRSYAEASTARPGATWKPAPNSVLTIAPPFFFVPSRRPGRITGTSGPETRRSTPVVAVVVCRIQLRDRRRSFICNPARELPAPRHPRKFAGIGRFRESSQQRCRNLLRENVCGRRHEICPPVRDMAMRRRADRPAALHSVRGPCG